MSGFNNTLTKAAADLDYAAIDGSTTSYRRAFRAGAASGGDDTTALTALITAAIAVGGGDVVLKPGQNYSALSIPWANGVNLYGEGASITKNGGGTNTRILDVLGSETATTTLLSGNAAVGDTVLNVISSAGFAVGDWVEVFDLTYKYTTSGRNEEYAQITAVGVGTITIDAPLIGAYATASTATVTKLSPILKAHFEGVTLIVPSGTSGGGLYGLLSVGMTVEDVTTYGCNQWPGIRIDRSLCPTIERPAHYQSQNVATVGTGYGSALYACIGGKVLDGSSRGVRENLLTDNCRGCVVDKWHDVGSNQNAFNIHDTGNENCLLNNIVSESSAQDGVGIGSSTSRAPNIDCAIVNARVRNAARHGVAVQSQAGQENLRIQIVNADVFNCGRVTASSFGVLVTYSTASEISGGLVDGASNANVISGYRYTNCSYMRCHDVKVRNLTNGHGIDYGTSVRHVIDGLQVENVSSSGVSHLDSGSTAGLIQNCLSDAARRSNDSAARYRNNRWGTLFDESAGATAAVADGGTITHLSFSTPTVVNIIGSVAGEIVAVTAVGGSTFTVAIKTNLGAAGTPQTIYWNTTP